MQRRLILAALAASSVLGFVLARAAQAQAPQKVYRIGFVANTIPNADLIARRNSHPAPRIIEEGLRELGWVDGKNVRLLWKSAERHYERSPVIIDEFVQMPVDVLVVFNNRTAEIALQKTQKIPIVIIGGGYLVKGGLANSLSRPGANLTGLSWEFEGVNGKLLQFLKSAAPRVTRVALLSFAGHGDLDRETLEAAAQLGLTIFQVRYQGDEFEGAVLQAVRQGANGLVFLGTAPLQWRHNQQRAHEASTRHRLPAIHTFLSAVESGGLMAYSPVDAVAYRRAPYFIDRILRGAKPSELPIEQPNLFELHLNLKTARRLGITFPAALVTQADRVFE